MPRGHDLRWALFALLHPEADLHGASPQHPCPLASVGVTVGSRVKDLKVQGESWKWLPVYSSSTLAGCISEAGSSIEPSSKRPKRNGRPSVLSGEGLPIERANPFHVPQIGFQAVSSSASLTSPYFLLLATPWVLRPFG